MKEIIKKYKLGLNYNGENILVPKNVSTEDLQYIKDNKAKIVELIREENEKAKKERIEEEKATVKVITSGWEPHTIYIDTRRDIDAQLQRYVEMYPHDCTVDSLRADFDKTIAKKEEKEKVAAAKKAETTRIENEIFEKARITGQKQKLRSWVENCNNPKLECNTDILTRYALPDGTTEVIRQHSF